MHSRKKNKNSAARSSSGKQLSIDLILPLFIVSVEEAAPLCSNSQPDQSTGAVAPVGVRSWDFFPFFAFCWLQVPTSCYSQGKDFGLQMFLHVLTTSI